jgi:hypothetical protein
VRLSPHTSQATTTPWDRVRFRISYTTVISPRWKISNLRCDALHLCTTCFQNSAKVHCAFFEKLALRCIHLPGKKHPHSTNTDHLHALQCTHYFSVYSVIQTSLWQYPKTAHSPKNRSQAVLQWRRELVLSGVEGWVMAPPTITRHHDIPNELFFFSLFLHPITKVL